jgi:hypothetical protein
MSFEPIGRANRISEDPEQLLGELDKRKLEKLESATVKIAICPPDKLPISIRKLDESESDPPDYLIVVMSEERSAPRKKGRATGKSEAGGKA